MCSTETEKWHGSPVSQIYSAGGEGVMHSIILLISVIELTSENYIENR